MARARVAVFGYSTEGYAIASRIAAKGADVHIVDESDFSAMQLTADIAKTYPDASALKVDSPLLPIVPLDVAISKAQYVFFAPRIRKTGQDTKTEIHSKFKDAIRPLKKNSSVVFSLPTGFGGNNENIALLEHVTGLEAGKRVSYYYYPLEDGVDPPRLIGSFGGAGDPGLSELLSEGKKAKGFATIPSAEHLHAVDVMTRFSRLCTVLEVCKYAQGDITKDDLPADEFRDTYIDGMVGGLLDLRSLSSSLEGANSLMSLINGSIKGVEGYVNRLIGEIRSTLKRNELKASRTKVAISWNLDAHAMRGDKGEVLKTLTAKLRDYIGDVETYRDPGSDLFHTEKTTIVVACSREDYDSIAKAKPDSDTIIVKANPLCETVRQ